MPILKVVLTDYWFDKIESGEKKHSRHTDFGRRQNCTSLVGLRYGYVLYQNDIRRLL